MIVAPPGAPAQSDHHVGWRAAIVLADMGGTESLTMRRLGQELQVEAMSLYNHVADTDEILDGIVDLVFSEIAVPSD